MITLVVSGPAALSALADRMLAAAVGYAERQLGERFGRFRDREGAIVPLVVLAMGKLGGGELNFSSDIDIVFLYPADGESDGPRTLSGQQFFTRFSQSIVSLLDERTADGFVFRVDTRLRPFGDRGRRLRASRRLNPICCSTAGTGSAMPISRRASSVSRHRPPSPTSSSATWSCRSFTAVTWITV